MRNFQRAITAVLLISSVLILLGCQSGGSTQAADTNQSRGFWERLTGTSEKITVPAGTSLSVRLANTLRSDDNGSGDSFEATLAEPIVLEDRVVIPRGAQLSGRIVEARASGHLKTPAVLAITLTELEAGGDSYDISTSTFSRRAASHKGRNAKWIGGSTAGGALLGALIGGGKGAAIGAGAGAGGGTAAAYATGKKDIELPAETLLHFRLNEPVTVTL